MSDFALFVCKKEEQGQEKRRSLFQYLYELLVHRVREPDFEQLIEQIEIFDNVNMFVVKLPYTINEIGIKTFKLAKLGSIIRSKYEDVTCIASRKFQGVLPFEGCLCNVFTGRTLFKSLLIQIIDEIYTKKNIEVSALDISIIHGESYEEIYTILNQLAPYVKFLTIITEEKERVEDEVRKIYYDTGLAVRVTNEYRSGMKNADLIINFGDSKEFVFNTRINPRALIINYGNINYSKLLSDNIIINGVEIGMPSSLYPKLNNEIFEYYSKVEVAEAMLSHKILLSGKIAEGIYDFDLASVLSREFKKARFFITGFTGRRNVFKAGDIKLYGT